MNGPQKRAEGTRAEGTTNELSLLPRQLCKKLSNAWQGLRGNWGRGCAVTINKIQSITATTTKQQLQLRDDDQKLPNENCTSFYAAVRCNLHVPVPPPYPPLSSVAVATVRHCLHPLQQNQSTRLSVAQSLSLRLGLSCRLSVAALKSASGTSRSCCRDSLPRSRPLPSATTDCLPSPTVSAIGRAVGDPCSLLLSQLQRQVQQTNDNHDGGSC